MNEVSELKQVLTQEIFYPIPNHGLRNRPFQ